jgi:hypothetical protein
VFFCLVVLQKRTKSKAENSNKKKNCCAKNEENCEKLKFSVKRPRKVEKQNEIVANAGCASPAHDRW